MRVLYFSEALVPPFDEGIKKAAWNLLRAIQCRGQAFACSGSQIGETAWANASPLCTEVLALTNRGPGIPEAGVRRVRANRLLASLSLWRQVRAFRPERVIYFPTACATLLSFVRARLLALYASVPANLIALQPRRYGSLARTLIPLLRSGPVWAQGQATAESLRPFGCDVRMLPPAVDGDTFRPGDPLERSGLRAKYGIPSEAFIVLHVGHLLPNRNVTVLADVQRHGGVQVIAVGSTAFGADDSLAQALRDAGVIVIDRYLERVEEMYQLADCYLFPVRSPAGSIEVPLSVLEAMACNLPVVSAPFGELPRLFPEGMGVRYYQRDDDIFAALQRARQDVPVNTRVRVEPYTWAAVAREVLGEERP